MGQTKPKPLYDPTADYETDFYLWSCEQAELLRQGRFAEIDLANIVEEIESLGRSDRRALISAYRVLIQHLLKWRFQPQKRSRSWLATIRVQRTHLATLEGESPSLAAKAFEHIALANADARKLAADETSLPLGTFPEFCPFSADQLRNSDWLPD
jgi:hypothetical protein